MKLEDQVCTLGQAKKLKELGIDQKSFWYWEEMKRPVMEGCCTERLQEHFNIGHYIGSSRVDNISSAFTVAELLQMAPDCLSIHRFSNGFEAWYSDHIPSLESETYNNPAQAAAELMIILIEEKVMAIEEVNNRLTTEIINALS